MRVWFETLGCKMNLVDTAFAERQLQKLGFTITEEDPDFVVVNTCTVTHAADRKSRTRAKHFSRQGSQIVVTGCSTKIAPEKWQEAFPGCAVCPTPEEVVAFFKSLPAPEREEGFPLPLERTRRNIAIQTGCDTYCSYCIIPFARGSSQSFSRSDILAQVSRAEQDGVQEIILTGINLAAWGASHTRKPAESRFPELLSAILKETSIPRIRLSSVGPEFLSDAFFEIFASPRICDHLHVSVQSGSAEILRAMNRGHGVGDISRVLQCAREVRPDVCISSDVIVGFPGETESLFHETVDQLEQWQISKLHVFPFSPRSGTVAAGLPDPVSSAVKKERAKKLRTLGKKLKQDFVSSQLRKEKEVLWEQDGAGWTTNFLRVKNLKNEPENTISLLTLSPENLAE